MGKIHARKLASMDDVALTCLYDPDHTQSEALSTQLCVSLSRDYEQASSDDVDAAIVASPTESHYAIVAALLEKGIHVFVEKPIAAEVAEAERLVDLARSKGLVLQVGHLERFNPSFRKALPFVTKPLLIEARRVSGFTGRSVDIDVVNDLMIHDIDLILALKGETPVKSVWAKGVRVHTAKADLAVARVEFEDGCVAAFTASRASQSRERSLEITQKDRHISIDLGAGKTHCRHASCAPGGRKSYRYIAQQADAVKEELQSFLRAVKNRGRAIVTGEDGLRALRLAKEISSRIEAEWK
jgi:predicted dehydrogenase